MNDADRGGEAQPRLGARDDGPEGLWIDDDDGVADRSADYTTGLVSLGFITAALRRGRRLWGGLAVLGLVAGLALWVTRPPGYQASTTLLLTVGPEGQPGTAILNDQTVAQSRGAASLAMEELGMRQSVDSFLETYKAAVITDRVLRITVSAPSSSEAVSRADAIASAFLRFRADQLRTQQELQFDALDEQVTQSERDLNSIKGRADRERASSELDVLREQVSAAKAAAQETTAEMVGQSKVLDTASPLPPPSRLRAVTLFVGAGLVIGLVLGLGIVIIRALVSDRLRRRDDIALALGAPVKLSVPAKPQGRWSRGRGGLAADQGRDMRRIVTFLRGVLLTSSRDGALAVVPVDDTRVAALSVVSLAVSCAQQDKRVVVADLCGGAPAAMLVGVKDPGVHAVSVQGAPIDVAIPDPYDVAPTGPFSPTSPQAQPTTPDSQVAAACGSADVVLTLATVDPALPSEHLATWAADVVVVVTAGRSSWTKIHAAGEMIRLAGTHLVAAVLVGADKWDESLGVTVKPGAGRDTTLVTGDGRGKGRPSDDAPTKKFISR